MNYKCSGTFNDLWFESSDKTPFAEEFNRRQREYWTDTGYVLDDLETIFDILIDDYNTRHSGSFIPSNGDTTKNRIKVAKPPKSKGKR